jgi:putative flavoprotein involved in K+ transport
LDVVGDRLVCATDLRNCLDQADQVAESIKTSIDGFIAKKALPAPEEDRYRPVWLPPRERAELDFRTTGVTSVVWCIGFRSDYSWIDLPLFNGRGQPSHVRGVTAVPGVYFVGLPWLYTWGSGRFSGVARDAEYLAERIKAPIRLSGSERPEAMVNEAATGS